VGWFKSPTTVVLVRKDLETTPWSQAVIELEER